MTQGSEETAQRVVESAYEAMSRRDLDGWLDLATPDFVIGDVPDLPDAAVYRGREEARRWAETTLASLAEWKWTVEEFLFNDGSTVVVRVRLTGQSKAGLPVEMLVFHAFEMRGDKMSAVRGFLNKAEALESAGLAAQENVEAVRAILANWAEGDYSSADWADPDIVFRDGEGRESRGLDVVGDLWREFLKSWEHFATKPERFIDLGGDRVLVLVRFEGRGRASGTPVTAFTGAQLFTLREGKVVRLVLFTDTKEALEAAGLSADA